MRIHERLDELYAIGGGVGANRVAGTSGEDSAHELAAQWLEEAGLAVEVDSAGNLIGRSADTRSMFVISISVSRLRARRATRSTSKRRRGSPARTVSPLFTNG